MIRMKVIQRYLAREILLAVGLVLGAFLALYIFFDFINELNDVGKYGYRLEHAVIFVLLEIPARAYELLPIAALIGTIYALAQLASRSKFTIMRMSGLSTVKAARMVLLPGLALVALTYWLGEFVTPSAEELIQKLRVITTNRPAKGLRTGVWLKDTVSEPAAEARVRFVNIGEVGANQALSRVTIYEFDDGLRLLSVLNANSGEYVEEGEWRLHQVTETRFASTEGGGALKTSSAANLPNRITVAKLDERLWHSQIKPDLLNVMRVPPERMSARSLGEYVKHLKENRQTTGRYEIAYWKKLIYPVAVLVMMALALPFAYLHARAGGISFKIFAGIMIGIGFYLLNSLFSHLGVLNTWPPFLSAAFPSIAVLLAAMLALRWVERH